MQIDTKIEGIGQADAAPAGPQVKGASPMGVSQFEIEPALIEDAPALARLVVMAGHGMPLVVWEGLREEGEDIWDVGARRAAREEGDFSYRKAHVIRQEGRAVSALVGYPLDEAVSAEDLAQVPALFQPLVELENRAVPSWYVNVLATFPEARGQGMAWALLKEAELRATDLGFDRLSIITGDDNPALQLYLRFGFEEITRLPANKDGWDGATSDWVLLIKSI